MTLDICTDTLHGAALSRVCTLTKKHKGMHSDQDKIWAGGREVTAAPPAEDSYGAVSPGNKNRRPRVSRNHAADQFLMATYRLSHRARRNLPNRNDFPQRRSVPKFLCFQP